MTEPVSDIEGNVLRVRTGEWDPGVGPITLRIRRYVGINLRRTLVQVVANEVYEDGTEADPMNYWIFLRALPAIRERSKVDVRSRQ